MADQPESNDSGVEENESWSNKTCIEISLEDAFPIRVKDITVQKGIINRFLNFYLTGKTQRGLSVCDIIFAVISIIPLSLDSEDLIWEDANYSGEGSLFYLSAEDKLKKDIKNILDKQRDVEDIKNVETFKGEQLNVPNTFPEHPICHDERILNVTTSADDTASTSDIRQNKGEKVCEKTEKKVFFSKDRKSDSFNDSLFWYSKKKVIQRATEEIKTYGPVENAAFCISCNKLLDKWNTDIMSRIYLKYFFGLVALTLMRTISKSQNNVMKVFSNKYSKTIAFCMDKISYSIPNKICIKKSFKSLRRPDRNTKIMFAKIVINAFKLDNILKKLDLTRNTGGLFNIFRTTVLTHTADYGLGIINMLQVIASNAESFDLAFQSLYSKETAVSWERVNHFLRTYMSKSSHQLTFHWARIIDKKYFAHLTLEKNFALAIVVAVFIEKLSDNIGIWKAEWVKTGSNIETYKQLGQAMYKDYQKKLEKHFSLDIVKKLLCNDYHDDVELIEDCRDDFEPIEDCHDDFEPMEDCRDDFEPIEDWCLIVDCCN